MVPPAPLRLPPLTPFSLSLTPFSIHRQVWPTLFSPRSSGLLLPLHSLHLRAGTINSESGYYFCIQLRLLLSSFIPKQPHCVKSSASRGLSAALHHQPLQLNILSLAPKFLQQQPLTHISCSFLSMCTLIGAFLPTKTISASLLLDPWSHRSIVLEGLSGVIWSRIPLQRGLPSLHP